MLEQPNGKEHRIVAQIRLRDELREEAASEPDPVPTGEPVKETGLLFTHDARYVRRTGAGNRAPRR